jgi:putative inorganic carbon (hco3(-)) transporter
MLPQQTNNQSLLSLIGRGLLAIGLGGGLGLLLVWLDNPLIAVVGFIGALAGIIMALNVDLGLLALGFMTFTRFSDVMVNDHGYPSIAKPFILLLAIGIVVRWLLYNRPPRGWDRALLLVGAYGVVIFLSLIYARDYVRSYDAASDFLKDGVICIMIVMILQNEKVFRNVAWALVVAGLFMGTISVFQYFTGSYSNAFWGFGHTSLSNIVGDSQSYRISGPFTDPNSYAQLIVVLVPLSLDRLMSARSNFARLIATWALVVCSLTVIITFSRGGFLSLVVVLGLYAIWKGLSFGNWVLISSLILVVVLLLPAQYTQRLGTLTSFLPGSKSTQNDVSFVGRMSENIIGVRMFLDHPILGVGVKNYPVYYIEYSRGLGLDQRRTERSPHSLYLEVAAEQGIVGILVFGILLYSVFSGLLFAKRTFNQLRSYEMENLTVALMIGFIGYLTSSIFLHGAYPRPFWVLVGLSLAFSAYAKSLVEQTND